MKLIKIKFSNLIAYCVVSDNFAYVQAIDFIGGDVCFNDLSHENQSLARIQALGKAMVVYNELMATA